MILLKPLDDLLLERVVEPHLLGVILPVLLITRSPIGGVKDAIDRKEMILILKFRCADIQLDFAAEITANLSLGRYAEDGLHFIDLAIDHRLHAEIVKSIDPLLLHGHRLHGGLHL